jgi:radical SAM protein with 4Fe4S-binding SPASM domain
MEARLLNIKYNLDLPVIQNSCSAGKSLYINPNGRAFPCYMIPPIADAYPNFAKYRKSWDIKIQPISEAEKTFEPFITLAQTHSQIDSKYCRDCYDKSHCKPCPLISLYDKSAAARCRIAERQIRRIMGRLERSSVPAIKGNIKCTISNNVITSCFEKGDYTSEKKFQINPTAKLIIERVNGVRTIADIIEEIFPKAQYLTYTDVSNIVFDLVKYLSAEGIVKIKNNG